MNLPEHPPSVGKQQPPGLKGQVILETLLMVGGLGMVFIVLIAVPDLATFVLYVAALASAVMAFRSSR